jgi:SAM-dependent methyltransferase
MGGGREKDRVREQNRYDILALRYIEKSLPLPEEGYLHFPKVHIEPFESYYSAISRNLYGKIQVLEIGSGMGQHTRPIVSGKTRVTALDISENSLFVLQKRFGKAVKTQIGNMEEMPFPDSSFDLIVSCGSLSYGDPQKVDSEIVRVLKPGGTPIFLDSLNHNPIYRMNRMFRFLTGVRSYSTITRIPIIPRIRRLQNSFDVSELSYFGCWIWVYPFVKPFLGSNVAFKFYRFLEDLGGYHRYAFKVLGVFRFCNKKPVPPLSTRTLSLKV